MLAELFDVRRRRGVRRPGNGGSNLHRLLLVLYPSGLTARFAPSFGRDWIAGQRPASAVEGRDAQGPERSVVVGSGTDRDTGEHQRHSFAVE